MSKVDPDGFGLRLKQAIKDYGITQKSLAESVGVSKTSINNYVQGRIPDAEILYELAKHCNITMEWLLSGENSSISNSTIIEQQCEEYASVPLNEEEVRFIDLIRQLPSRDRAKFEGMIELKIMEQQEAKSRTKEKSSAYPTGQESTHKLA